MFVAEGVHVLYQLPDSTGSKSVMTVDPYSACSGRPYSASGLGCSGRGSLRSRQLYSLRCYGILVMSFHVVIGSPLKRTPLGRQKQK
jgi:hypothetical protein